MRATEYAVHIPPFVLLVLSMGGAGCAVGVSGDAVPSELDSPPRLVSHAALARSPEELANARDVEGRADGVVPSSVDLRSRFAPPRDQGERGTCLAFVTAGAVEFFLNKASNTTDADISEQMLAYDALVGQRGFVHGDDGTDSEFYNAAVHLTGAVEESVWAYEPKSWWDQEREGCTGGRVPVSCFTNGEPPEAAATAMRHRLTTATQIAPTIDNVRNHFASAATPLGVGFDVDLNRWWSPVRVGTERFVVVPPDGTFEMHGSHAVLLVGYDDEKVVTQTVQNEDGTSSTVEQKGFLLVRNSWGTNPSNDGYLWVSYDYARAHLLYADAFGGLVESED